MPRYSFEPKESRNKRGTVLGLTLAIFGFVLFALFAFNFKTIRLMGGQQEQTTAAEAAALAAAKDISNIVINDPNFGWISLSNQTANGTATVAKDGYPLPVRSINDILGTIRLDMLIAGQGSFGHFGTIATAQAVNDYNNALTAQANLVTALQNAVSGNGAVYDANGNAINIVADATNAYKANIVRMTGNTSQLAPNSLKVSVGYCQNGVCNTPVPHNHQNALDPTAPNSKGWYLTYVDCPYGNYHFVFAAVANVPSIVDTANYLSTVGNTVPYATPSVVKVDADQIYTDQSSYGTPSQYTVHCTACAEAGSNPNIWPTAGALVIGFPDGKPGEIQYPLNLGQTIAASGVNENYFTAGPGDVPGSGSYLSPSGTAAAAVDTAVYTALYDWLKSCGPTQLDDVFSYQPGWTTVSAGTPCFFICSYGWQVLNCQHAYGIASNGQVVGMSSSELAFPSTGDSYDLLIVDNVSSQSGQHGGTPVYDTRLVSNTVSPPAVTPAASWQQSASNIALGWDAINGGWGYALFHPSGNPLVSLSQTQFLNQTKSFGGDDNVDGADVAPPAASSAFRPKYPGGGLAVEITLHKVVNVNPGNGNPGGTAVGGF